MTQYLNTERVAEILCISKESARTFMREPGRHIGPETGIKKAPVPRVQSANTSRQKG